MALWLCLFLALFLPSLCLAADVYAAVAANFLEPARVLAVAFQHRSGHVVHLSSGSTAGLYAQISHGAPFDVLLAADERTPAWLVEEGWAREGSRFTYAVGTLVMWSADAARIRGACQAVLRAADYRHVAIANPAVAPYGAAAKGALQSWGLWASVEPRLLRGESVAQAFQFVATGNAELGFVAGSQVVRLPKGQAGSLCIVDRAAYPPLRQQAVLLKHGEGNAAARAFLAYLRSGNARMVIAGFGYSVTDESQSKRRPP